MLTDGQDGGMTPVGIVTCHAAEHDRKDQNDNAQQEQTLGQLLLFRLALLDGRHLFFGHTLLSFAGSTHST